MAALGKQTKKIHIIHSLKLIYYSKNLNDDDTRTRTLITDNILKKKQFMNEKKRKKVLDQN